MPIKKRLTAVLRRAGYRQVKEYSVHYHDGEVFKSRMGLAIVQLREEQDDLYRHSIFSIIFKELIQDVYPQAIYVYDITSNGERNVYVKLKADYSEGDAYYDILRRFDDELC